jgi:hypothetical protein
VECEKAELRTEAEIIQVKERGGGDKITPLPPAKRKKKKRIVCRDPKKRENHEVGWALCFYVDNGGRSQHIRDD